MDSIQSVDSNTQGDPQRFMPLAELERRFALLPSSPQDQGRVILLVSKAGGGLRQTPRKVQLAPGVGMPGDARGRDPELDEASQLAVMQRDVAELVANGQPLTLFGDNLFLDLDLSTQNLPAGSRLRVGQALLEVTPLPHNGCVKFRGRFGDNALRFVSKEELRHRNLRGIYMRVVEAGEVVLGDMVEVISRGGE
jgi:hypothetical protein